MKTFLKLVAVCAVLFLLVQLIRPSIPFGPAQAELQAPPQVKQILQKDCYACHSTQRRLAWFDYPEPAWWLVRKDILTAREHLNFSTLAQQPAPAQKAALYEAVNMIQLGAMPLPRYRNLHPDANVSPEELAILKSYLAPWTPAPDQPANAPSTQGVKTDAAPGAVLSQPPVDLAHVQPEWNGYPFDPSFAGWKVISFTDRGDNNTFRFVLGNDIAWQATQSGNIAPWPNGARFAKIAWQQQPGADGMVHPGKFVQVELMEKQAQQFKSTEGWGWGRWRGMDLKPYGKNAQFVRECTGCHLPVRGNDFVYTLPITLANAKNVETVNSLAAGLPSGLAEHPLQWNPITLFVDPGRRTLSALLGNPAAYAAVRPRGNTPAAPAYPVGTTLALITWSERDDPHWFGARIPSDVRTVEFVSISPAGKTPEYHRYAGVPLAEVQMQPSSAADRIHYITGLAPASLP